MLGDFVFVLAAEWRASSLTMIEIGRLRSSDTEAQRPGLPPRSEVCNSVLDS